MAVPAEGTGLLDFWFGVPYWNRGYATEAVSEVARHGFEERGLLLHALRRQLGSWT